MDLISAKVEASKLSRTSGRKVYVFADKEGECDVSHSPLKGTLHCYSNGSEVALEQDTIISGPKKDVKTTTTMATAATTKSKPAKAEAPAKAAVMNVSKGIVNKPTAPAKPTKEAKAPVATKAPAKAPAKEAPVKFEVEGGTMKTQDLVMTAAEWEKYQLALDKAKITRKQWVREAALAFIAKQKV